MAVATEALDVRACEACGAENPAQARFCKACGGAVQPPPHCPECDAEVPSDARFCPGCGARLVGARPSTLEAADVPVTAAPAAPVEPAAAEPATPVEPEPAPSPEQAQLAKEAEALPAARRPSSNIGSNVLLFVAILMVLLVAIYQMNKDAEKEVSPFAGGPPPAAAPKSPASPAAPAAPSGAAPIRGTVVVADGLDVPQGTLFVIVRNAGVTRGPPLAVKRFDTPSFPQAFSVGPGDVMMKGMPFTGPFDVQARLDADGNAMTKAAGDLATSAPVTGVEAGASVDVRLDKRL